MKKLKPLQKGFTLISTIFILVILAALGGYMVKLSTVQTSSSILTLQSTRAWFAAVAGLEWATYQITNEGAGCPALSSTFTLEGFTIISRCYVGDDSSYSITEGDVSYTLYDVEVSARYGSYGSADFVSRSIRATIASPPEG